MISLDKTTLTHASAIVIGGGAGLWIAGHILGGAITVLGGIAFAYCWSQLKE